MTEGLSSLQTVKDLLEFIYDKWIPDNTDGKKPEMVASWKVKEAGHMEGTYRKIILQIDSENVKIYSLLQRDSQGVNFWDWLHEMSFTFDIRTGISEEACLKMANELVRILKRNAFGSMELNYNVQMLPGTVTIAHEDYRNLFRILVDVDILRYNP